MNEKNFNGLGNMYSQYRPQYPQSFIDYLYSDVGITSNSIIADIGSGTGILTKQLLDHKNKVYAVEPNADMRKIAVSNLQKDNHFISINGSAEETTLGDRSLDFITVAQAFHWFNSQRFKIECNRILKTNGKVILVWNSRDEQSELMKELTLINQKYCPKFKGFSGGMGSDIEQGDFSDFFKGKYEVKVFDNNIVFNMEGFIGRNLSASYALKETDLGYCDFIEALKSVFEKYSVDGQVTMVNVTRCYVGHV